MRNSREEFPPCATPGAEDFTLLRHLLNPAYHELATWFGRSLLHRAARGVPGNRGAEVGAQIDASTANHAKNERTKKFPGRSPIIATVQPVIGEAVARRKWNPTMAMKALTREVNRAGKWPRPVSEDTVTRGLDLLYEQSHDRRFERVHRRVVVRLITWKVVGSNPTPATKLSR